jgi:hypothetical protein
MFQTDSQLVIEQAVLLSANAASGECAANERKCLNYNATTLDCV